MSLVLLDPSKGHFLKNVTSTNDAIRSSDYELGSWIVADSQSSGRGRNGKRWIVSGLEHIVFAGKNQLDLNGIPLTLVSLFSSASLLKAIFEFYPEFQGICKIKWPNDIYKSEKKIAGFLIESTIDSDSLVIILGFGLNIYGVEIPIEISNTSCYLLNENPLEGTKERILASFIKNWNDSLLKIVGELGIDREIDWIEKNSLLIGRIVQFTIDGILKIGMAIGYDRNGFLVIMEDSGRKYSLMDTDSSFRIVK